MVCGLEMVIHCWYMSGGHAMGTLPHISLFLGFTPCSASPIQTELGPDCSAPVLSCTHERTCKHSLLDHEHGELADCAEGFFHRDSAFKVQQQLLVFMIDCSIPDTHICLQSHICIHFHLQTAYEEAKKAQKTKGRHWTCLSSCS